MKVSGYSMVDPRWYMVPLGISLCACAGDTLSLGDEEPGATLPPGARCAASATLQGTVVALDQADLDALAGCEAIVGNLEIAQFEGADLRPLASLRSIEGDLDVGNTPSLGVEWTLEGGWLESLEGLEGLERVGALMLDNINAPSLQPLSNLRNANADVTGSSRAGNLFIGRAHHLVDLNGLDNLAGVTRLQIIDNESLESLDGLALPARLEEINLALNRRLSNIDALANVRHVDFLQIADTGLRDLTALSELGVRETVSIGQNAELVDIGALPVWPVERFSVEGNPRLDGTLVLPAPGYIYVAQNAELDRIVLEKLAVTGSSWSGGGLATSIFVGYNPSLTSIDLGEVTMCAELSLVANDNLSELEMPVLEGAAILRVAQNPRLSTTALAELQTLERMVQDNAD